MFDERPIGDLITKQIGGGTPSRRVSSYWNGPIPWASVKDFTDGNYLISSTQESISLQGLSASASNLIPAGTPMICTRMAVGRSAIAQMDVAINQDVKALQPSSGISRDYLLRLLQFVRPNAEAAAVGSTVKGIRIQDFLSILAPIAPVAEQFRIAEILNALDTASQQTDVIIEKLRQVKQGLLHDLLTRGIDASGELRPAQSQAPRLYKNSPLGWIPKEWAATNIRDVASLVTSGSRGWADYYTEAGALFLRSQNVRMGNLDFTDRQHVLPPKGAEGARTKLTGCDILITITGNSVGNVACVPLRWDEQAFVSQHVGLVRLHDPRLAQLTMHYLVDGAPGHKQLIDAQYGQSKPGLSLENLRRLSIPTLPNEEQEMIVQRLHDAKDREVMEERYAMQLRAIKDGLTDDLLNGRVRVTPLLDTLGV